MSSQAAAVNTEHYVKSYSGTFEKILFRLYIVFIQPFLP